MKSRSEINILLVEDSLLTVELLTALLRDQGYANITAVQTLDDALNRISFPEVPYDAIFLDRYLGEDSSMKVLEVLNKRNFSIPVIMLTQEDDSVKVLEAIALGATDYIVKPFCADIVLEKLNKALKRRASAVS